jgi:thioredoxin 1
MLTITNESDFQPELGLVAVKFGAEWCGPCKKLEPNFLKIEEEFSNVKFMTVDVDQIPSIAQKYRIRTLPTILLLKNNKEINRINGLALIDPLRKAFRDFSKEDI